MAAKGTARGNGNGHAVTLAFPGEGAESMSLLADDESYGLYNVLLHAAQRSLDIPEVTGDTQANLDEIELYADVLTAAAAADGPLTREEIDAVLGVRPARQPSAAAGGTGHRPDAGSLVNVYLREVKRVPRLTPGEEAGLIEEFRAARAAGQRQGAGEAPGNDSLVAGTGSAKSDRSASIAG